MYNNCTKAPKFFFVAGTDLTTFEKQVLSVAKIGQPAVFECLLSFFRQTKQYNVALLIYQMLQSLACLKPTAKQNQKTHQQAQALLERLETTVKKVGEALRTTAGVGVTWYFSRCRFFSPVGRPVADLGIFWGVGVN